MTLSNTATPIYYGQFKQEVLEGRIPVCTEVEQEMNRIDSLIADPKFYYDDEAVNGYVSFCENELCLTDGTKLNLLPTFKLWAESLLGWYYFEERQVFEPPTPVQKGGWVTKVVKLRLVVKQYLIVARGAAKSLYESSLQAYFLVCDVETTQQITTAPTMKQAEEVMSPIRTAITRARGPLFKFMTMGSLQNTTGNRAARPGLAATKKGIENFLTNSYLEVRPMTIDKLQGLRSKYNTVDEWLSGDMREDVVGAIEQGASKNDDYAIVAVSSEGTVRNGAGDTMKMELAQILKGDQYAPHISIWHYKLDDLEEVKDPFQWLKAQPNLHKTVPFEVYRKEVERAQNNPSQKNDIFAKRFGWPSEGLAYFFAFHETMVSGMGLNEVQVPRKIVVDGLPCSMGADLSQGDDFCAFSFLFPLGNEFYAVKTRSYISDYTLRKLPGALRFKYEEFIKEGSLHVMDGTILDIENDVCPDLEEWIYKHNYDVRCLGYDVYNSKEFLAWYTGTFGDYNVEKVAQGYRTETVPLGEMKKLAEKRAIEFDQLILAWTMANAAVEEDNNGNRKLFKRRNEEKVDNVAAWMDAWIASKIFKEALE